jgi:hypothetical protein
MILSGLCSNNTLIRRSEHLMVYFKLLLSLFITFHFISFHFALFKKICVSSWAFISVDSSSGYCAVELFVVKVGHVF